MKILFFLPEFYLNRCFRQQDRDRLKSHQLVLPTENEESLLRRFYEKHIGEAEILVPGYKTPTITPGMVEQAVRLQAIIHSAGSIKKLIPLNVWERGIRVATANDAVAINVAETTLGLMITGLKGIFPLREWVREGNWKKQITVVNERIGPVVVHELFGLTIGIISASKVGRHVIRLLRNFEVEILVYDPFITEEQAHQIGAHKVSLEDLMKRSNVVSIHAPTLPETKGMITQTHLRMMRDHAILINTARGIIVDEAALIEELKTGRISAFLDVTSPEPPAPDHPFRTLPNVVLTPHIAGGVAEGCFRQGRSVVDQILEFQAGKKMHGEITQEMLAIMA